jgi:hypothetical protein
MTILEVYKLMILQEPPYLCEPLNLQLKSMKLIKRNHRIYIPYFKLVNYKITIAIRHLSFGIFLVPTVQSATMLHLPCP